MERVRDPHSQPAPVPQAGLSMLVTLLFKGVIYREDDERLWTSFLQLQARIRDHVAIVGLELVLDEAEGYGFLKSRPDSQDDDASEKMPRLVARRPLSFPVSLLLALLRKKLAEFDASGGDTRMVLTRDDLVEMIRVFLPGSSNEAKLVDQIENHINKIVDLGFLQRLKSSGGPATYEVKRIIKAFVDAQWLSDFDARLAGYQAHMAGTDSGSGGQADE